MAVNRPVRSWVRAFFFFLDFFFRLDFVRERLAFISGSPPLGGVGGGACVPPSSWRNARPPPLHSSQLNTRSGVKKPGGKKMTLVGFEPGRRVSKVSAPSSEPHPLLNTAGGLDASRIWFFGPPSHFGFCNKRPF